MHDKSVALVEELIYKLYELGENDFWPYFISHKEFYKTYYEG